MAHSSDVKPASVQIVITSLWKYSNPDFSLSKITSKWARDLRAHLFYLAFARSSGSPHASGFGSSFSFFDDHFFEGNRAFQKKNRFLPSSFLP
jgi:hypothetical protein